MPVYTPKILQRHVTLHCDWYARAVLHWPICVGDNSALVRNHMYNMVLVHAG